ncbi:hypothetical protein [Streptomyces toxytricini]|uniref:hypothetical protein n=1 Tax=Streptomyces toxytricini TaxID=67369 RepID=UPI00341AFF45
MPSSAYRRVCGVLLAVLLALPALLSGVAEGAAGAAPAGTAPSARAAADVSDRAAGRAAADGAGRPSGRGSAGGSGRAAAGPPEAVRASSVELPADAAEVVRASAAGQRVDDGGVGRGPRCGPGADGPERAPGLPARAGVQAEHVLAVCARAVPGCGTSAVCAVSGPPGGVQAPDRPAPGPVELSVMRV